jgi:molybdopterin converting factor subunit 1
MRVSVLFFASLRERAGTSTDVLELVAGARVSEAVEALLSARPMLRPLGSGVRFAVNADFASADVVLNDGDELALLPPVSGG